MKSKLKILVVDDEQIMRDLFVKILRKEEHEVVTAQDGKEAVKKIKENNFDIVFMDIRMPDMNGVETFGQIKKLSPKSKVFMMTAFEVPKEIEKALQEGARGCLFKPFGVDEVLQCVSEKKAPLSRLPVRVDDEHLLLDVDEIFYVAAKYNGSEIHTEKDNYWMRITLTDLEKRLGRANFVRTHRGYLVNLDKVRKIAPLSGDAVLLVMKDEKQSQVLVSRARTKAVKKLLGLS